MQIIDEPETDSSVPSSSPFIRRYNPSTDRQHVEYIFRATASPQFHSSPAVLEAAAHLWCLPYLALAASLTTTEPDEGGALHLPPLTIPLVLDSGVGQPVGYLLGAPSTAAYSTALAETYLPSLPPHLRHALVPFSPSTGDAALDPLLAQLLDDLQHPSRTALGPKAALVVAYPAHLHIDILPSHQGCGWGAQMMAWYLAWLREFGVRGVFLGVGAENTRAIKFYEREGFVRYVEEEGGNSGSVVMVRRL